MNSFIFQHARAVASTETFPLPGNPRQSIMVVVVRCRVLALSSLMEDAPSGGVRRFPRPLAEIKVLRFRVM